MSDRLGRAVGDVPSQSDLHRLTVSLTNAFAELARQIAITIEALTPFAALLPPKDLKARALARKHRPFTCHRHGVQAGGFCRSCNRG